MITLRKNCDRRIRKGHLWVFSNEIATPPVSELEPGEIYELRDHKGEFLGMVYANPSSLITARILSRRRTPIDEAFIMERLGLALERRKRIFPDRRHYRMVFGEADLLPGLVVDRYGSTIVTQSLTAGTDRLQEMIVNSLVELTTPECVFMRNDSPMRSLEGLPLEKKLAYGSLPDRISIDSHGVEFAVDVVDGQKTGFFLDQESNRDLMRKYVPQDGRVLDLFCYTGGWGLHAAAAGAAETVMVDSSQPALDLAALNATTNKLDDKVFFYRDSALEFLKRDRTVWDVVVLDPPAYIKSRAQAKEGLKGYIDINRRALNRLNTGGILVTCSCSHHLDQVTFEEALLSASRQSGRELRILEMRGQSPDHPFLLSMPETRYLKVIVAQVL
jgi:23S rRNA (cytosine1962-C5)-methyltransferase